MTPHTKNDKRKFFRHPFGVPIRLTIPDNGPGRTLQSQDISQGGLSFLWGEPLSRGRQIQLTIPVKEKRFEVNARVAYSRKDAESGYFRTGVAFIDTDSAFRAKLAEETLEILEYQKDISRTLGHEVSVEDAARQWIEKYAGRFNP